MIYNSTFLKVKKILAKYIINHIKKHHVASDLSIHGHVKELKESDPETFKLIEFSCGVYPHSDQVADVLTDLIRDFIIDETDEGYVLTSFGKRCKNI